MKAVVYPRLLNDGKYKSNPYIEDFINGLEALNIEVENKPHKNPFLSLLLLKQESKIYFFHWIENIPQAKYGILQATLALLYILYLRMIGKKIVWFLHNKKPHDASRKAFTNYFTKYMAKRSHLIITHAREGVDFITHHYPYAAGKTFFLDHPTKNRIVTTGMAESVEVCYDIVIWGVITPYKKIPEFLKYLRKNNKTYKVKIAGRCVSRELEEQILENLTPSVEYDSQELSYTELNELLPYTRFVLIPYASESVLSSGILMDSLSFGCRVIGPDAGSFRDYVNIPGLQVSIFKDYDDICSILEKQETPLNRDKYIQFLEEKGWPAFTKKLLTLIGDS